LPCPLGKKNPRVSLQERAKSLSWPLRGNARAPREAAGLLQALAFLRLFSKCSPSRSIQTLALPCPPKFRIDQLRNFPRRNAEFCPPQRKTNVDRKTPPSFEQCADRPPTKNPAARRTRPGLLVGAERVSCRLPVCPSPPLFGIYWSHLAPLGVRSASLVNNSSRPPLAPLFTPQRGRQTPTQGPRKRGL